MLELRRTTPTDPAFRTLVAALDADLRDRYGDEQDQYDEHNVLSPTTPAVIAVDVEDGRETPVGCGAFRRYESQEAELKRMFVGPEHRGRGIATAVLTELEKWAREEGFPRMVLETGPLQTEAIAMYERSGYRTVENFGVFAELPASLCFAKAL